MKELSWNLTYGTSDQRTYVRLPFEVPDRTGRIELVYSYPRSSVEADVVDLGLYDEKALLRGWSGSERNEIFVGVGEATPGYRSGPLESGSWAVALGLYKIQSSVSVTVTLRLFAQEPVLLAADLHLHTVNSDGAYETRDVINQCRQAGLDVIALTDHNNTAQNGEIGRPQGLLVLPGMEYTNYRGHANFFFPGDSDFRADPLSNTPQEMAATFRAARSRGALIAINHPFCDFCPWEMDLESTDFDLIELWNGPMKASEMRAIGWWQGRLAAGRRIPGIGGSDMHRHEMLRTYGAPTTWIHADSISLRDVFAALAGGRTSLSSARQGPRIDLQLGGVGLGGEVVFRPGLAGLVRVERARPGDRLQLIDASGSGPSWDISFPGEFVATFEASETARFYRAELWRLPAGFPDRLLTALTNPVYLVVGS